MQWLRTTTPKQAVDESPELSHQANAEGLVEAERWGIDTASMHRNSAFAGDFPAHPAIVASDYSTGHRWKSSGGAKRKKEVHRHRHLAPRDGTSRSAVDAPHFSLY
jgi:hypothetical protein